ncbi:hypothetical protein LTR56_007413 [Elasticomyces elasticus]|nr:hypothetical protein LTR56_007413 [Elasticomyces elasticus]KAK3668047.1 hypothetical protein LTR22_001115 [Elasticomyces elasticus]KAK4925195.1 hypothetical protein LTR49_007733 [Elasticomyces elasticus]KAK5767687.1 hypothetical protein LTS12_002189 [Elasticomyces elasticus]
MAAAQQVLNLSELLETILLGLPTRDLLFSQKVCKTWKAMIEECSNIQKALFLLPGEASDISIGPEYNRTANYQGGFKGSAPNSLLVDCATTWSPVFFFKQRVVQHGARGSSARMLLTQPPRPAEVTYVACLSSTDDGRSMDGRASFNRVTTCTLKGETLGSLTKRHPKLGSEDEYNVMLNL